MGKEIEKICHKHHCVFFLFYNTLEYLAIETLQHTNNFLTHLETIQSLFYLIFPLFLHFDYVLNIFFSFFYKEV